MRGRNDDWEEGRLVITDSIVVFGLCQLQLTLYCSLLSRSLSAPPPPNTHTHTHLALSRARSASATGAAGTGGRGDAADRRRRRRRGARSGCGHGGVKDRAAKECRGLLLSPLSSLSFSLSFSYSPSLSLLLPPFLSLSLSLSLACPPLSLSGPRVRTRSVTVYRVQDLVGHFVATNAYRRPLRGQTPTV
eukprot:3657587-Rhodomonas_salina.1